MRRDLLFKGYCKGIGNWVIGLPYEINGSINALRVKTDCGDFYAYTTYKIEPNTLSAFTGLYDVNRNKIWENDTVRVRDNLGSLTGKVVWSKEHAMFVVGTSGIGLGEFDWFDREVIKEGETK